MSSSGEAIGGDNEASETAPPSSSRCPPPAPPSSSSSLHNRPVATFNQIPFQQLSDRVEKGTKVCIDLHGVMKGRLDILDQESRFSDMISRTNIYENEIPQSSSEKSIGMMKNYFLYLTRELVEGRKYLDESVAREMEGYKLCHHKQTSQYTTICQTAISEVDIAYQKLDFSKEKAKLIETSLKDAKGKLHQVQLQLDNIARLSAEEKLKRVYIYIYIYICY